VTNLGAILFAKRLDDFPHLRRKAVRVIAYDGNSRIKTLREQIGGKGYAAGFDGLIGFVNNLLPSRMRSLGVPCVAPSRCIPNSQYASL
jgi:ATP-dependent DNA helicase RecG